MKIIILGAGQVGSSLAETLSHENNDIAIVDTDEKKLEILRDRLDIHTICGLASHPDILEQAGGADAEMLIAVTNSDEVNMVACQVAYTLFHTPTKIARVRSSKYIEKSEKLFSNQALPIDILISPEQLVTSYIQRLIEFPGALQVLDFEEGKVQLVAVKARHGGLIVGQEIQTIRKHMPNVDTRVAAIFRRGSSIIPKFNTIIEEDDEVFFVVDQKNTRKVMAELRRRDKPNKRIMIAGGGNIGRRLALALETKYRVKLIDRNLKTTKSLSEELHKTIVLLGDASDEELLIEENIDSVDVFCALTNDDEANIMSALLAKRLGAKKVMALINRTAYVELVESGDIDIAISPQQVTMGSLLPHVRHCDVVMLHSLRKGAAEAIEVVAHGDPSTSDVVGRNISEIKLPKGSNIGAIIRDGDVIIAHHDTVIKSKDKLILFLINKEDIRVIEKLFKPDAMLI